MFHRVRSFISRHPMVRQALIWAIPAIVVGAVLRGMLLSYLPLAYWGSDSRSYFSFAEILLTEGELSLYDKRRYIYPIFLLPITLLPGSPLSWLAWIQHALGLATLVPLAYLLRKTLVAWRVFTIPLTVLYAGLPILIWYEHELLAETIFFDAVVWTFAGWLAFCTQVRPERARTMWWWFFAAFAVVILTKPAGRFFWPGVIFALVFVGAWRVLSRWQWVSLAALLGLTFTIGRDTQGAWLLYTSAFPLTKLNSPLHAEYKAQITDMVERARAQFDAGQGHLDREWNEFLKAPEDYPDRPLWAKLHDDEELKEEIYTDLAKEAIFSRPIAFIEIALRKIVASANPDEFKTDRFLPEYYVEKFEAQYEREIDSKPHRIRMLFDIDDEDPIPPYAELRKRIAPRGETDTARWLRRYADRYQAVAMLVNNEEDIDDASFRPLAWWLFAGIALAFLPWNFRGAGICMLWAMSYLVGTFLVGGINARYFGAVWAVFALALALPFDTIIRGILAARKKA